MTIQAQVLELMTKLKKEIQTSMILITHDLGVVAEICDKVAIMYAGEIIEFGDLEAIYDNTAHPYTIRLFGAIPDLEKDVDRLEPILGLMPDPSNLAPGCRFCPRCANRKPICETTPPPEVEVTPGHMVKCHLYKEGGLA